MVAFKVPNMQDVNALLEQVHSEEAYVDRLVETSTAPGAILVALNMSQENRKTLDEQVFWFFQIATMCKTLLVPPVS